MEYYDEKIISKNIRLVRGENGELYIKKAVEPSALDIYRKLEKVDSRNVVKIYDVRENDDGSCEVLEEYVDGTPLYDIAFKRNFTCEEIKFYAAEVCSGVQALHKIGVIHRDLTYNNILLSRYGEIKIVDFDISRSFKKGEKSDTTILGTPGFAAPEQYGFLQSSEKTDIYAVGSLMAFMLEHSDDGAKSPELSYIAQKCVKFVPELRYKNIAELKKAILNAEKRRSFKIAGPLAKFTYYFTVVSVLVIPVLTKDYGINRGIWLTEVFCIYIFPVMFFGNEFDWQKYVPELKYARKPVKILFMITVYLLVLMGVIIIEAIKHANG